MESLWKPLQKDKESEEDQKVKNDCDHGKVRQMDTSTTCVRALWDVPTCSYIILILFIIGRKKNRTFFSEVRGAL